MGSPTKRREMDKDTQLIVTTVLFILHWILSYIDRRRIADGQRVTEPYEIHMTLVIDPKNPAEPIVHAYGKQHVPDK